MRILSRNNTNDFLKTLQCAVRITVLSMCLILNVVVQWGACLLLVHQVPGINFSLKIFILPEGFYAFTQSYSY
jgi:hypothetical protein